MAEANEVSNQIINLIPRLRNYARSLTRNHADADDLVQETIAKALRHYDRFEPGSQIKAWLFTIMRNTFYTTVRKTVRERPGALECVSNLLTVLPDHDHSIAHSEVLAAISRLPSHYREMITLVVVTGESYQTASALCNCAVGTVKSRVNRARNLIVDDLEGRRSRTGIGQRARAMAGSP